MQEPGASTPGLHIDSIKARLRVAEGLVLHVYKCPAGKRTIGYGHNLETRPLESYYPEASAYLARHGVILDEHAEILLDKDLESSIYAAKQIIPPYVWEWLSLDRRGVIVEMIFNMGAGGFLGFSNFRKALLNKDIDHALIEMKDSKWFRDTATHNRAVGLIKIFAEG